MLLQKLRVTLTLFLVSLTLVACGGASGDKAAPPVGGITATPGNGQVTITWTQTPGVEYWLAYAATSSPIDISNLQPGHVWATNISSPYVVTGLTNGVTYSFAMNARTGGGPGGAQTPSVSAIPRVAGATWTTGAAAGTTALRGLTFDGTNYVAVGDSGAIYKSTTGTGWNLVYGSNTGGVNLRAALYVNSTIGYVVAGATNIYHGLDLATLVAATGTGNVNALATNGTTVVAVGDNSLILSSTDGTTWNPATTVPSTAYALRGVAVSNGIWVAVGDAGTVFTSSDLITWSLPTSYTAIPDNLRAVAGYAGAFVAVGDSGKVVTSADGSTWTSRQLTHTSTATPPVTTNPALYAVNAASGQFLCVGAGGAAFSSPDRTTWTDQSNVAITGDFLALTGSPTAYFAVGTAGLNAVSR